MDYSPTLDVEDFTGASPRKLAEQQMKRQQEDNTKALLAKRKEQIKNQKNKKGLRTDRVKPTAFVPANQQFGELRAFWGNFSDGTNKKPKKKEATVFQGKPSNNITRAQYLKFS